MAYGSVTLNNLTLTGGDVADSGGAVFAFDDVSINNSTIRDNHASFAGGGIYGGLGVDFTLTNSTVSNNRASDGGGIYLARTDSAQIQNTTISGNVATTNGGGLIARSGIQLSHVTITLNRAASGGGIHGYLGASSTKLTNTLITGNTTLNGTSPNNIQGPVSPDSFYNLVGSNGTGSLAPSHGNLLNVDAPQVGPLANNGGPTLTHMLLPSSLAIGAGVPTAVAGANGIPANDQRGTSFTRVVGGIDIGAVESTFAPAKPTPRLAPGIVDLSTVVPNLDFEGATMYPEGLGQMVTPGQTVEHWFQLSAGTPDYGNAALPPFGSSEFGEDTLPENGSAGFIGLIDRDPPAGDLWHEYAANVLLQALTAGTTYQFDLFAGTPSLATFTGEIVIYGLIDTSPAILDSYKTHYGSIETFAAGNVVELHSVQVDINQPSTWISLPNQLMTVPVNVSAIVIGTRSEDKSYLLVDAAPSSLPQVTDVRLSSTNPSFTRAPISFRTETSLGGPLTGTGSQIQPISVVGLNTIEIEFSEDVVVPAADLRILSPTGTPLPYSNLTFNPLTNTARLTLNSALTHGNFTIQLNRLGSVGVPAGALPFESLDGEWDNPTSLTDASSQIFSSGNGVAGGEFSFQFSVLQGDYNRNGIVDALDYTIWRNTKSSTTILWADGNGDGQVDVTDFSIWKANFGRRVSDPGAGSGGGSYLPGDINRDGTVDLLDRGLWQSAFGSTTEPDADLNFNGIVDMADLQVWQGMQGATLMESLVALGDLNNDLMIDSRDLALCEDSSETALVTANFGLIRADVFPEVMHGTEGLPLNLQFAAPVVLGIAVGATNLAAVAGTGEQLRSVAAAGPNSVSISFSEEVLVTSDALEIFNLDGTSPGEPSAFTYDLATQTATWTYSAPIADGRYLVRLSDAAFDLSHESLDGEFFNPISLADAGSAAFPSGDGDAGGEFRFRFTVLAGDTDHNNIHGAANYQNWHSTEPGMIIVSTTADDWDASLAFGDVSLREAVHYANTASQPVAIQLPTGRYVLTRTGTEGSDTAQNDLDVLASMSILGAGAGLSIIDNSGLTAAMTRRAFDVAGSGVALTLDGLTIAHGTAASENGLAVRVGPGASLEVVDSALVHHISLGGGAAIYVDRGDLAIRRSVVTNNWNQNQGGAAVYVKALTGAASVLVEDTLFAVNHQYLYGTGNTTKNVEVVGYVTKTNNGGNLYDDATGGFFDTTPGAGDRLGSVDYIVTSVADTMNHADDSEALSIREAVDLANQAAGTQEVWLPAWRFTLTLDRGTNATDTDVSYGDLDVKESLVIRGVAARTRIAWKSGVVDKVFDLLGDSNYQNESDYGSVSAADYTVWQNKKGQSGAWEQFSADADDDGDVDADDYAIWSANFGHTLELFDIAV